MAHTPHITGCRQEGRRPIIPPFKHTQATEAHFLEQLQTCPFIAVLRGVDAAGVAPSMQVLAAEGFTLASIPAEAPAGLEALRDMGNDGKEVMLRAATVVSVAQVERAAASGAAFVSCPHVDPEIIERCVSVVNV